MGYHSSKRGDLFLLQTDVEISRTTAAAQDEGQPCRSAIIMSVPFCCLLYWIGYWYFDLYLLTGKRFRKSKKVLSMCFIMPLVIGTYMGRAYIYKIEPHVASSFPFAAAVFENAVTVLLLPIGIYYQGMNQLRKMIWPAGVLSLMILLVWGGFIVSLGYISVTSAMAIEQLAPVFLYVMETAFLNRRFEWGQFTFVVLSLVGFAVMATNAPSTAGFVEDPIGLIICFLAIFLFAVYQIVFLRLMPNAGNEYFSYLILFFGVRGLWGCLIGLCLSFAVWFSGFGYHHYDYPTSCDVIVLLAAAGTLLVYGISHTIAWIKFTPVWVALACAVQIPISLAIDAAVLQVDVGCLGIIGILTIFLSVLGYTYLAHFRDVA